MVVWTFFSKQIYKGSNGHHLRSGCPEARRFPSRMMDFYTFMSTIDRIIPVYTYSLRKKFLTFKGWKKYGNAKVYQSGKCPRKTLKMENSATQFIINRASTTAM